VVHPAPGQLSDHELAHTEPRRQVREIVREYSCQLGYGLHAGRQAAGHWLTTGKGEYFAAGIRGPLIGRRADLVIIDDPIKSQAEADSPVLRERAWNWYRFDLTTRLKPRGRIVLIMTRWHEDDLAGRLLAQNSGEWFVLRLPALAEEDDSLQRDLGTALWPEWEDKDALLRKRDTIGERAWSALFQQTPRPIVGSLFKIDCIDVLDASPTRSEGVVVRAWDLAATMATGGNDPDWTAGIKLTRDDRVGLLCWTWCACAALHTRSSLPSRKRHVLMVHPLPLVCRKTLDRPASTRPPISPAALPAIA
jgi:hypothetical protein